MDSEDNPQKEELDDLLRSGVVSQKSTEVRRKLERIFSGASVSSTESPPPPPPPVVRAAPPPPPPSLPDEETLSPLPVRPPAAGRRVAARQPTSDERQMLEKMTQTLDWLTKAVSDINEGMKRSRSPSSSRTLETRKEARKEERKEETSKSLIPPRIRLSRRLRKGRLANASFFERAAARERLRK